MTLEWTDIILRLGSAAMAGLALGINRDMKGKPIGARTLSLVGLGAAIVVVSTISYQDTEQHPDAASRVLQGLIQGLMAGISFIGAGVILRDVPAKSIHGLTTAATVWVATALGIACGLAMWRIAIVAIAFALFVLIVVEWIERKQDQ
jgi:putative Mg2+ transporter-C (MgtC) family protein